MKKIYFSALLAAMTVSNVQAQVFQYLYGTTASEMLTDGHNTSLGGQNGHFLVSPLANTPFAFSATRTNNLGSAIPAGSPFFSNEYRMSDVPIPPGAPNLRIREVHSVEQITGAGYAVAGSYSGGASSTTPMGVFYQQLDPVGNLIPGSTTGYFVAGTTGMYSDIHVSKIVNSSLVAGDMYILGTLTETTGGYNRIFVLRIRPSGALVWSRVYRLDYSSPTNTDIPYDIVESRQMRGTTYEVMVVGDHYAKLGGQADGFLLRIDYLSGNMINPVQFYGTASTDEGFSCIKTSANTAIDPAGAGYVIGGHINNGSGSGSNIDYWFVAVNQNGNAIWANTYNYNNGTGVLPNDYCRDLIESNSSSTGLYEYYLAGYTDQGVFGSEDMMVIHTDQAGNILPLGQFTYGTPNQQRCLRIDQDNSTSSGGIAMYGSSLHSPAPPPPLGSYDLYLVKATFSGSTACDYDIRDTKQSRGPGFYFSKSSDNVSNFTSYRMYSRIVGVLNEYSVCSSGGCTAPKPPLVAHWNFTGGNLTDPVNGLTGVIHGGVTPAAGFLGTPNTAYQFDGSTGYIQVPSSTVMDLQSWTLTALVQPQGFYSGTCQANSIIWRGNEYSNSCYSLMFFDNATDGSCYIYTPTGEVSAGFPAGTYPGLGTDWLGATPCVTNPCINLNQWYCLWLSYDAVSGNLDMYVDGILRVTLNWPNQYGPPAVNDLFIGSSNDFTLYPYYFNGIIDDIAIFGGPLVCPLKCSDAENGLAKKTGPAAAQVVAGDDIKVLPNPTTGNVELSTSDNWKNGTVTVLNSIGQEVTRQNIDPSGKTMIDLSGMPAGVYLLRTQVKGQYTVKKVIKN